jgi:hypothetical protein
MPSFEQTATIKGADRAGAEDEDGLTGERREGRWGGGGGGGGRGGGGGGGHLCCAEESRNWEKENMSFESEGEENQLQEVRLTHEDVDINRRMGRSIGRGEEAGGVEGGLEKAPKTRQTDLQTPRTRSCSSSACCLGCVRVLALARRCV